MPGEIALSILLSPVGVMLAMAVGTAVFARHSWRSATHGDQPDSLAGLFQRDAFADQLRDPKLRHIRARGQKRPVSGPKPASVQQREAMLHQVAAVLRGSERDAELVREATRYLAGEGFVVMADAALAVSTRRQGEIVEIADYEEVKLLPPPTPAKAA